MAGTLDLIVPLGSGSCFGDDELRILLRSAERKLSGLGRVILAANTPPKWIRNVHVVSMGDPHPHNKDANLIRKVLVSLQMMEIRGDFILAADDNVFVQPCDARSIPVLYNKRKRGDFTGTNNWHRRMRNTFDVFPFLDRNYECHAPQVFNAAKVVAGMASIDYGKEPGLGIYTAFRAVSGQAGEGEIQGRYKSTHESAESASAPLDRLFAGYNDEGFGNGLRERLFRMFPEPSRYER